MSDILYSLWHRTLGYSYFAMDVDYVEIRNDDPVAVIETSLCTPRFSNCKGEAGVFNRFLRETGGFQFEVTYWVARWLKVPAYLICLDPNDIRHLDNIHVLNLNNCETVELTYKDYQKFIKGLPDQKEWFSAISLDLPNLLQKLSESYPGIKVYPYFRDKQRWLRDYQTRENEISNLIERLKPPIVHNPNNFSVKGETTGDRPRDYDILRNSIDLPYVNINWIEWRKDSANQKIGRPAALVKTERISVSSELNVDAIKSYAAFIASQESSWWTNIAKKMLIRWYFVVYTTENNEIGNKFFVWRSDGANRVMNERDYKKFLMQL